LVLEEQVVELRERLGEYHRERTSRALGVWRPQRKN